MNWSRMLLDESPGARSLSDRIGGLFTQQRQAWPAFCTGEAALARLQRKTLTLDGESIIVQVNPARRGSTLAKTDAKSVAARPCFLCAENMPAEERGLAFEDLVVLPNPFPILPGHCTIAARDHRLQQLAGRIDTFLRLTEALGPEMAALYNGPRCGASAPDHLHFQAARAEVIPILGQLPPDLQSLPIAGHESFGRKMAIFTGPDAPTLQSNVERAIDELRRITNSNEEPMLNLLAYCQAGRFTVILFPRAAHRPAFYFATGSDHLAISPAVLEMCGILVATEPEHFDRVDANVARGIYEEVSIPSKLLDRLLAAIATG